MKKRPKDCVFGAMINLYQAKDIKIKKLYSLCIVDDRDEEVEDGDGVEREEFIHEKITLYISINAL